MSKSEKTSKSDWFQLIVFGLAAVTGAVISLFDMFCGLDWMPLRERLPQISLLATSMVLGLVLIERYNHFKRLTREVQSVRDYLIDIRKDWFIDHMDPLLAKVFGHRIRELSEFVDQAVHQGVITLHDEHEFRFCYGCMLDAIPKAHFVATSLARKQYFWSDEEFNNKMARFIQNRGRVCRIFFVDPSQKDDPEVLEILRRQFDAGVEVWVTDLSAVPAELLHYFVVEKTREVAWEVQTAPDLTLKEMTFTTNRRTTEHYRHIFRRLQALATTHKYVPPDAAAG